MAAKGKNHYEVLEIREDAELIDIKKAYRRLALRYHPDRNNGSALSTEKFKEISEAYTILSDSSARRNYDLSLKYPATTTSVSASGPTQYQKPTRVRDPFQQFDDLFRNDPFFNEAFNDMDDAFAQRFGNASFGTTFDDADAPHQRGCAAQPSLFFCAMGAPAPKQQKQSSSKKPVSWSQWLMNKLGIELSVTSYSHQADGSVVASAYTSKPSGTYTNKTSRTYMENGQQVTVISMEKNRNKIEDKFIAGKLVERKVNGKLEELPQQVASN
ncbi:hypothetical protein ACHAWU_001593 [Discostella pseudostelligera]|uniref:J domain-containing protein n=1 Tax=Discostella pseudostelligera TaxID=259834 RepID=A0ABD3MIZ7_9STRA